MTAYRLPGARRRVVLCVVATCWAVASAAAGMFSFLCTTMPVQYPAADQMMGPAGPSWIPAGLFFLMALADLLVTVLMPVVLVALLAAGLWRLRAWWAAAWTAAVAVAVMLEVAYLTDFGGPHVSEYYTGPAVPDWAQLADVAGFLALGGVMIWVVAAADRSAGRGPGRVFRRAG